MTRSGSSRSSPSTRTGVGSSMRNAMMPVGALRHSRKSVAASAADGMAQSRKAVAPVRIATTIPMGVQRRTVGATRCQPDRSDEVARSRAARRTKRAAPFGSGGGAATSESKECPTRNSGSVNRIRKDGCWKTAARMPADSVRKAPWTSQLVQVPAAASPSASTRCRNLGRMCHAEDAATLATATTRAVTMATATNSTVAPTGSSCSYPSPASWGETPNGLRKTRLESQVAKYAQKPKVAAIAVPCAAMPAVSKPPALSKRSTNERWGCSLPSPFRSSATSVSLTASQGPDADASRAAGSAAGLVGSIRRSAMARSSIS